MVSQRPCSSCAAETRGSRLCCNNRKIVELFTLDDAGGWRMNDFKGRHFESEIVLWAVRWYCRYPSRPLT